MTHRESSRRCNKLQSEPSCSVMLGFPTTTRQQQHRLDSSSRCCCCCCCCGCASFLIDPIHCRVLGHTDRQMLSAKICSVLKSCISDSSKTATKYLYSTETAQHVQRAIIFNNIEQCTEAGSNLPRIMIKINTISKLQVLQI